MAKKNKTRMKFPRRVAGVKVPREMRRFLSTPFGAAVGAGAVIAAARAASQNDQVRRSFADLRDRAMLAFAALTQDVEEVETEEAGARQARRVDAPEREYAPRYYDEDGRRQPN